MCEGGAGAALLLAPFGPRGGAAAIARCPPPTPTAKLKAHPATASVAEALAAKVRM
jgi:hypothetical protein